jgi:hypothetical protein
MGVTSHLVANWSVQAIGVPSDARKLTLAAQQVRVQRILFLLCIGVFF